MHNLLISQLGVAAWQTVYMVFISSFLSIFFGLVVGVLLFSLKPGKPLENKALYAILGFFVNFTRSVPFIILMVAIIPLTRLIVGTAIGTNAAIVPLIIAAIPFYARLAESAVEEVPGGLLEAADAMGATAWQSITKVLLPEALPVLVRGASLTIIGLIGYSAMAGAVGGGGLGELAIDYGYQQFNAFVMLETVVLLVIIVQLVQWFGDRIAVRRQLKGLLLCSLVLWIVSGVTQIWPTHVAQAQTIKVGIMSGIEQTIMEKAKRYAQKHENLDIQFVTFDDYILPNTALENGSIDANIFQTAPYLKAQIKARGYKLTPIAKTFVYPMGVFSKKIQHLRDLRNGAIVAIPNDPSNEGRALRLLQKAGLIALKPGVGLLGTPIDVISNPKQLQFKTLAAAQLPRVFQDADLVALNNDFVKPAGFTLHQALFKEGKKAPYANIIVVREKEKNRAVFKKLIKAVHSVPVLRATQKAFPGGAAIPAY